MMSSQKRIDLAMVTAILLFAAALRFTGLAYGQPIPKYTPEDEALNTIHQNSAIHPDEFLFVQRPLRMLLTGELNPKFFHNPSFLINLNLAVYWLTGEQNRLDWEGRDEIGARRAVPFRLYLNGRTFSALGGMLAVAATYAATRLLTNHTGAALAALVVSVSVPMVQHAHYTTTSSLAAGFAMMSIWASFASLRCFRWWIFALAGLSAGFAAGCRYNAAAVSIVVFVVGLAILSQIRPKLGYIWVILGYMLFPLGFAFTTPHIFFDTAFVWSEFQTITGEYIGSGNSLFNVSKWTGLVYELNYMVLFGLGIPASVLALIGVGVGIAKQETRIYIVALLTYLFPYAYVVLRTIRPMGADQMLVPIIPAVVIFTGVGWAWLWGRLPRKNTILVTALILLIIVFPLIASTQVVWLFTQRDTRYDAKSWVFNNVPTNSVFHLNGPYNVPLDDTLFDWDQTFATQELPTLKAKRQDGIEYVIESDAWLMQFERSGFISEAEMVTLRAEGSVAGQGLDVVYVAERPTILGSNHPMHSKTYWHHPTITIYCLTDAACDAVR